MILLANHAGLRRGDCLRVAPCHWNADQRLVRIHQQKTGNLVEIPASPMLAELLNAHGHGDPNVPYVEAMHGKPISARYVSDAFHLAKLRAGVNPELWIHDLRRTLAVSLYEISKDLRIAQQGLGHQSLASTVRYLEHRDPTQLRAIMQELWTPKGPVQ